jgi:hypothetical protein
MSDREIHINDKFNKNIDINYHHEDSSDNDMNDDDTLGFGLLADNKKLGGGGSDIANDIDIDQSFKTKGNMDKFMDSVMNNKSERHSSRNKHSSRSRSNDSHKKKHNAVLSQESSLSDYNYKPQQRYTDTLQDRHAVLLDIKKYLDMGYIFSKEYSISSNYEEMKADLDRVKMVHNNKKGIKFCRNALMTVCSGIEQLSDWTSFGELDGWSEDVSMNIESYDDIFEELYQKYGSYVDVVGPEIKLVLMLIQSAFLYHIMRKMTGPTMKNFENIINKNTSEKKSSGGNPIGDLLSGFMGGGGNKDNGGGGGGGNPFGDLLSGGLGKFMGMGNNMGNSNIADNSVPQKPSPTIIETKTPVRNNDYIIKKPDLVGLETLLDDQSDTSKSTTTKMKNGKRTLSLK